MRKILIGSLVVAGLAAGSLVMAAFDPIGAASAAVTNQGPGHSHPGAQKQALKRAQSVNGHEHPKNWQH